MPNKNIFQRSESLILITLTLLLVLLNVQLLLDNY